MKSDSIQSVIGTPKWEARPKLHHYPTKRWGHTGAISKNKLFIYGGKTGRSKEPLYEIDCESFQSHIHEISSFPDCRQSHSCSLVKDKLYIWGGCRQQKALNDCISITVKENNCIWTQIAQFPTLKQRQSHATTVLKDKFIFLYGGSNEDEMYDDFWIFNTQLDIWFQVKNIIGKMKKRLGCTLTVIKDKIYIFGGETEEETYFNQLYCLSFTEPEIILKDRASDMKCQKIIPLSSNCPPGRSSHSAVSYLDRYIIIIAGQGSGVDAKGKTTSVLLNDVWCYDTEKNIWQIIDIPNKNSFKPRSCFSANLLRNKIFIFGGLVSIQNFKSSDQLFILTFTQTQQKNFQVCQLCKLHYRPMPTAFQHKKHIQVSAKSSFQFSISSLYKISRMIKNPFDAICLIIQAFNKMKYKSISIDLVQGKLLMVQGTGPQISQQNIKIILNKYQFPSQINTQDKAILDALDKRVQQQNLNVFSFNLKNACSRLGQNFLLINRRGILIDIIFVTQQNIFYCQLNLLDNTVLQQQQRTYEIIRNYMHKNNLNVNCMQPASFVIIITDLQKISPIHSQMKVNGKDFIQLANSQKKTNLQNYCSTMFLRKPEICVVINSKKIQFKDQQQQYKSYTFQTQIQHDLKRLKLKQSQKQTNIYIYRDGIRVGRYIRNKKLYIEGYVEISINYELNLLRNRIQNYRIIQQYLDKIYEEFQEMGRKRNHNESIQEYEQAGKRLLQ